MACCNLSSLQNCDLQHHSCPLAVLVQKASAEWCFYGHLRDARSGVTMHLCHQQASRGQTQPVQAYVTCLAAHPLVCWETLTHAAIRRHISSMMSMGTHC